MALAAPYSRSSGCATTARALSQSSGKAMRYCGSGIVTPQGHGQCATSQAYGISYGLMVDDVFAHRQALMSRCTSVHFGALAVYWRTFVVPHLTIKSVYSVSIQAHQRVMLS